MILTIKPCTVLTLVYRGLCLVATKACCLDCFVLAALLLSLSIHTYRLWKRIAFNPVAGLIIGPDLYLSRDLYRTSNFHFLESLSNLALVMP